LKEGKKDYLKENIILSCLILLLVPAVFYSQLKINNFTYFRTIKTNPGYKKFEIVDFNEDNVEEFILYGLSQKRATVHRSLRSGSLSGPISKFFYYPITEIKKLKNREDYGAFYLIISESNRLAALTSFTKYGTLLMLNRHEFESSPSGLLVTGEQKESEAFVFGKNFNGISRLTEDSFILREKKVVASGIYLFAVAADFNYNETEDLIAYELLGNKIHFFTKDKEGNLFDYRVMDLNFEPSGLKAADVNNDNYIDLCLTSQNYFYWFEGDSVSSFGKSHKFTLNYSPFEFSLKDIDGNNFRDLIFISGEDSSVYASRNIGGHFHAEEIIAAGDKICDIRDSNNSLYFLSKRGFIYSSLNNLEPEDKASLLTVNSFFNLNASRLFEMNSMLFKSQLDADFKIFSRRNMSGSYSFSPDYEYEVSYWFKYGNRDIYLLFTPGVKLAQVVSLSRRNGSVNKAAFVMRGRPLDIQPTITNGKLVFAAVTRDSSGDAGVEAFLFDRTKNKLESVEIENVIKKKKGESAGVVWRAFKERSLTVSLSDNKESSFAESALIDLGENYSLPLSAKGSYRLFGNNVFFYNSRKITTGKRRLPAGLNTDNVKYYEDSKFGQMLFVYDSTNKALYWIYNTRGGRTKIKKLIDSVIINTYIAFNYYGELLLAYKSDDFDKVKILRCK